MMDWIARHRRLVLALICAFWAMAVVLALRWPDLPFLSGIVRAELSFEDLLRRDGRKTPARNDFVFVGIDQQSLQLVDVAFPDEIASNRAFQLMTERPYPWSRELWALLLDRLFAAGARVVMFDIIFNPPNDGDAIFADAITRHGDRVVLGLDYDQERGMLIGPNPTLIPPPPQADDRVGLINYWPDPRDGKVRAAQYVLSERQLIGEKPHPADPLLESLTARALTKIGHAADVPRELRRYPFRFCAPDAYPPHRLWEILNEKFWTTNYGGGAFFKDKIVIVGSSAQIHHDVVDSPFGANMPGPALHLHALAAALSHEFLAYVPPAIGYSSIALAGVLAWMLIALVRRPIISLIALIGVALTYLLLARILYDAVGLILLTIPVLIAFVGSGASSLALEYILERREKLKTRRTLERYVSKNLVKEILDNPSGYYNTLKGARKPVTTLFADLVGFTNLSERAEPEELVGHLNELLSRLVAVVFENNGTLDKFIGDAIMAVWGNVRSAGAAQDAKAAARSALGMQRALKELNARWRNEGKMPLGMGIGINHGIAVVGNIGSYAPHERLDPTVIGDSVNLASRLEALTRTYGVEILVGEAAAELIRDEFHLRSVARVQVKGKTVPVGVSALLCAKGEEYDAELLKWLQSYEEGIEKFRARDFTAAKILFQRFLEFYPKDYLAKTYLDRALEYEQQPPGESWTAAEVFTKK